MARGPPYRGSCPWPGLAGPGCGLAVAWLWPSCGIAVASLWPRWPSCRRAAMSGLEFLLVPPVMGAGAAALGLQQYRRDCDELAASGELPLLTHGLREACVMDMI